MEYYGEPFTSNLYTRSTLAGKYTIINKHLVNKLISLDLWTDDIRKEFIYDGGSIQNIKEIPDDIKNIYKTAYEMKTKPILDQAIGRGPFICQSQSMNIFFNEPNYDNLTSSHFYGWEHGLKTGMYYLRSQPASNPLHFGLDYEDINNIRLKRQLNKDITLNNNEELINDNDPRRINEIEEHNNPNINKEQDYINARIDSYSNACGDACGA
jgi:ribonucleotide reductase alpha subunit